MDCGRRWITQEIKFYTLTATRQQSAEVRTRLEVGKKKKKKR